MSEAIRMVIFIPKKKAWIREIIEERVQLTEVQGVESSLSKEVVEILEVHLREQYKLKYGKYPT